MKLVLCILLFAVLAGCAPKKPVVPSLEGKPRIKINQQLPAIQVPATTIKKTGEQ